MTPTSPTWGDVERFLEADNWRRVPARRRGGRRQPHIFFEKVADDGRVLQTHISHDRKATMSPGRFNSILRTQLEVSRDEFWAAVRSGDPVYRPVPVDADDACEHEDWVIRVLVGKLHMSAEEIEELSVEEARQLVQDFWAKRKG